MAITTWVSEDEQKTWVKVNDRDVNQLYQEVRAIKPTIYLHEVPFRTSNIFNRKWVPAHQYRYKHYRLCIALLLIFMDLGAHIQRLKQWPF